MCGWVPSSIHLFYKCSPSICCRPGTVGAGETAGPERTQLSASWTLCYSEAYTFRRGIYVIVKTVNRENRQPGQRVVSATEKCKAGKVAREGREESGR